MVEDGRPGAILLLLERPAPIPHLLLASADLLAQPVDAVEPLWCFGHTDRQLDVRIGSGNQHRRRLFEHNASTALSE